MDAHLEPTKYQLIQLVTATWNNVRFPFSSYISCHILYQTTLTPFDPPPLSATSKNCFGLTAGEIRSQAMILLVIGAIFSIFPCSVFYYFSRSKNNRSNNNMNNNNSQYVPQIVHAGTQQPQYGQHQKQFNQQPVQGQFVQHQQPVQAQYIPQQQPVQYIGTPQPIVVQQPYAQPVQPVAPGQPQYNQGQVVQPVQVQYVTK
jgi:hypothetical protein